MATGIDSLKSAGTLTGQLITVASGLLAFTVTFAEKFTPEGSTVIIPTPLKISWVCFAVSILFGFWTLMALTGTLTDIDRGVAEKNPARWNIRMPAIAMFAVFFVGLIFLIIAGWTMAK